MLRSRDGAGEGRRVTADRRAGARTWPERLADLALQVAWTLLAGAIAWRLPTPTFLVEWMPLKNLIVGIAVVVLIGKGLYDTLFYDRFWP